MKWYLTYQFSIVFKNQLKKFCKIQLQGFSYRVSPHFWNSIQKMEDQSSTTAVKPVEKPFIGCVLQEIRGCRGISSIFLVFRCFPFQAGSVTEFFNFMARNTDCRLIFCPKNIPIMVMDGEHPGNCKTILPTGRPSNIVTHSMSGPGPMRLCNTSLWTVKIFVSSLNLGILPSLPCLRDLGCIPILSGLPAPG